jgi:actin
MQRLWDEIVKNELNLSWQGVNVLVADNPLTPKEQKQKIAHLLFDELGVKSLALMNSAVLSLFSTGRTTGIVVEVGQGVSYAVPIFEGYALPHAVQSLNIAGQDITK